MTVFGAIRFDGFYTYQTPGDSSYFCQQQFSSPAKLSARAPWFYQTISPYMVRGTGSQAILDQEIQMAAAAGIDYFAFDCYQPKLGNSHIFSDTNLSLAWDWYQASPYKNLIKWCWITGMDHYTSDNFADNTWKPFLANMAVQCAQSTYQKVLGNRPLVGVFSVTEAVNTANMSAAVTYFGDQCVANGIGRPYMFMLTDAGSLPTLAARCIACGYDAVSNYNVGSLVSPRGAPETPETLFSGVQSLWSAQAALGKVLPVGVGGYDSRIANYYPPARPYVPYIGNQCYFTNATPARIGTHVQALRNFATANPAACDANAVLWSNWNECIENGIRSLIPSIGDPPQGANGSGGTNLLNALKSVLRP